MNLLSRTVKTFVCVIGTYILAGCAMSPPKPPEVIGEYRPLNRQQSAPKAATIGSYTVTAGTVISTPAPNKEFDWEILESDGTLRKTLERWAKVADWEIVWTDLPEFKNPGYVKLTKRDFTSATDYVLNKARNAAKEAGIEFFVTAYSNRVLVISKEAPQ